ncbi:recombinase family protein [uncultured Traorella sp.]|uniref:recombinase family protein n=1 Tax=uncultured Traorella sp. TaxID=1929048 RepID=UPI0025E1121C|nr:recombinase family protein [uncultured Traorella sp.]
MKYYGYIRVSTKEQNEDRQVDALKAYEIPSKNVFMDKQSGKDFERPAYQQLIRKLKKGDVLIIKSIDRLGRNYDEIIEQWRVITKQIDADIVVIDMPLLDTRVGKDLTGKFVADLVLQILSYVAQTEREAIRQRQAEGIAAAKARGVKFGRPRIPLPSDFHVVSELYRRQMITSRESARMLSVSQDTFLRWNKTYN